MVGKRLKCIEEHCSIEGEDVLNGDIIKISKYVCRDESEISFMVAIKRKGDASRKVVMSQFDIESYFEEILKNGKL